MKQSRLRNNDSAWRHFCSCINAQSAVCVVWSVINFQSRCVVWSVINFQSRRRWSIFGSFPFLPPQRIIPPPPPVEAVAAATTEYGGFPNDIRPVNIKLKRVSENINSNRVSENIKNYYVKKLIVVNFRKYSNLFSSYIFWQTWGLVGKEVWLGGRGRQKIICTYY